MLKPALIVVAAVSLIAFNSPASSASSESMPGAKVTSVAQAPITKGTTTLSLNVGPNPQAGQLAIADVLSYQGSQPTITAPDGWQLIRDDSTQTTRQSLYMHTIEANDPPAASWTFSDPVDAQGAILLLDNVASDSSIDSTSGNPGSTFVDDGTDGDGLPSLGFISPLVTAKSLTTTSDGNLILAFNATDFGAYRPTLCTGCNGLNPTLPENASVVLNQESTNLEYWIMANYQGQTGPTAEQVSAAPQLFNWVAAQIAVKPGTP
jgi:hypothetical protein